MTRDPQRRHAAKDDAAAIGDRTSKSDCPVIVVGIGASAGGLKSLKQIFAKIRPGHGGAFVLIQHLDPSRENLTVRLLKDLTALAVVEAADGMPVLPDRIHVIPPDKFLSITGSRLTLQEPVLCNGLRMPIDHFFCSLAADQRSRGCGIVLSGAGSDGTLGLSEIKAAGGRTLAEDPGTAEFRDMPQSAIDAGVVDAVLPADAMAEAIIALADRVTADTQGNTAESPEFDANLRAILEILRLKVGHDFRCYKPNTVVRRIRRRMTLAKIATFADYARFLKEHPEEVGLLQKDLLIGVTEFFRQPKAWEILEEKVIPVLVERAELESEVRVWVPGCSTGKEAYTLAMLLTEQVEKSGKNVAFQIFATDSDTASLAAARSGIYSMEEIGEDVSPDRLKRFFGRKDSGYQVIKEVRERIVFAPQNLAADPPFSRLDLISCRNLLIYLDQEVQKKIIPLFHFALREGGFLFLGSAETIGDREDLFESVSKKWRIYRRIGVSRPMGVEIPVRPAGEPLPAPGKVPMAPSVPRLSLASAAQKMLLDRFAPACVMIDRKLQVLYVHGTVEDYLTFPPGELTTQVVDMAREGLKARLRGAIGKCVEINRPVSITARVRRGKNSVPVKTIVSPLRYPRETEGMLLITFEDYRVPAEKSRRKATGDEDVQQLHDELKVTREELQSTIEQLESSNDQFKASNEEVTAANEELQSANEELETSKEELQSLNEELNTINARLHEKVGELEDTNNDVLNLLSSTNIATVFLDKELKLRRYTPAGTCFFSLMPSDVGRPISEILRHFTDETLLDNARRVLVDLTPLAKEVQAEDGRWYIRRITPYRTQDDRIEGVVVTFVDIDERKRSERELFELNQRLQALMHAVPVGISFSDDPTCQRITGNPAVLAQFEVTQGDNLSASAPDATVPGRRLRYFQNGRELSDPELPLQRAVAENRMIPPMELEVQLPSGRRWLAEASSAPVRDPQGNVIGGLAVTVDITERKQMEEELKRLASFPMLNPQPVVEVDLDGRIYFINPSAGRLFPDLQQLGSDHPWLADWKELVNTRQDSGADLSDREVMVAGRWYHQSMYFVPHVQRIRIYGRDITEHKKAEEAILRAKEEWERTFDTVPDLIAILDDQHRIVRMNRAMADRLGVTSEQCIGLACYEAVHGMPEAPAFCPHVLTCQDGQQHMDEVHEPRLGGDFLVSTTPLCDPQGKLLGSVHVARDITKRKRAEKSLQDSEARFKLLSDTAGVLLSTDDPQATVNKLCRNVMAHLDCQAFFNFLVDEETGRLHLNACAGIPEEEARKIEWLDYGVAVCGCAARDRVPIIAEDICNTPDPRTELVKSYGIQAYACHPLMVQGKLIGTLSFGTKTRTRFSLEHLALMRTVTNQVATAMERVRLIKELQRSRDELEMRVQERTAELAKTNEALHAQMAQREQAEKAVKAERQRLNDILEVLPAYVVLLTPDYHVPFANRFFRERFGDSLGRQCFHYLFGRTEPCEICETFKVLKTNAPHHWEWTGPDGRNYDIHDFPFTDADGSPLIMEMGIDITERKKAEEQVKESAKQLRDLSSRLLSAQEDERRRVALEIHDTIGACLSAVKFKVEDVMLHMGDAASEATKSLKTLVPIIQESIAECRRIQMDLRPSILDDLGLLATLSWFCRNFQTVYSTIRVEQEIEIEEEDVPPPLKIVAFRVTQEAMNNAAKHSHADLVRLSLRKLDQRIELVLQDNGLGFDLEKVFGSDNEKRGLGLTSMRERTGLSGGSFMIESTRGKGTIIRVSWPL